MTFGVDPASGRAFIEEGLRSGFRRRLWLYFVWQESWSGPWARRKLMRGKFCYHLDKPRPAAKCDGAGCEATSKPPRFAANGSALAPPEPSKGPFEPLELRARQYRFQDGRLSIAPEEDEELLTSVLPSDDFQWTLEDTPV